MPGEEACDQPIEDTESRYRITFFYALYDQILNQMEVFFVEVVVKFSALAPNHYGDKDAEAKVRDLGNFYENDVDVEQLLAEYQNFRVLLQDWFSSQDEIPTNLLDLFTFLTANNLHQACAYYFRYMPPYQ